MDKHLYLMRHAETFCNCQTFHYRFEKGRFVCMEIIDPDLSAPESPDMPAQTRRLRRPLKAHGA